jgi:hypothetical protein
MASVQKRFQTTTKTDLTALYEQGELAEILEEVDEV